MTGEKNTLEGLDANSLARFPKHNVTTAHCNEGTLSAGSGNSLRQNRAYGDKLESDDAIGGNQGVVLEGKVAVAFIRTSRPLSSKCFTCRMTLPCIVSFRQFSKDMPQCMK